MTREQECYASNFEDGDMEYCEEQARQLVAMRDEYGERFLNDDGTPMTYSDWLTVVMKDRYYTNERVRGMMCAEIGVD